ncbi:hypothetical protein COLO4_07383 [Corchorus olitorius]|uniref:Uncharacterized protein n=1 Tax=Corchorus olitorius TaxID=93759 RepID=A0A1R3KJX4_9ROSI|nr:hypothetical protein COLO4_07383 [Corchorus olitorius]
MNSLSSKLKPLLSSSSSSRAIVHFSSFSVSLTPSAPKRRVRARNSVRLSADVAAALKEGWLDSLSCPLPEIQDDPTQTNADINWVIGVDPDLSGALALLKTDPSSGCSAQVFDSPHLPVRVGNRVRKRLDTRSIVQLVRSLDAPLVSSPLWKKEFELTGAGSTKDDSRRIASTLFPSLSDQLKRKKDHGRAEALLIAAYGKGLRMKVDPSLVMEKLVS